MDYGREDQSTEGADGSRSRQCTVQEQLGEFWQSFLGKKGSIADLMKGLGSVPKEERPNVGKTINEFKNQVEARYQEMKNKMDELELAARNKSEQVDITMPAKMRPAGGLHPLTVTENEMIDVFAGMGFEIFDGPEIEDDDHNFTRLNVAKNHPARDMQDTFYVAEDILLRTHTSPGQIRVMDAKKPPIKMLAPGRVFRSDEVDATHSPSFHQIEGLVIDKNITFADLKGTLQEFAQELFGPETKTKFRPHHFPFTEPSAEVDVSCFKCGGKGCRFCKGSGWIEILGCGTVHPNVLRMCGIDPDEYTGFAFGVGLERIALLKYEIDDMRLLYENDVRFLKQF